ncbi:restriction endonuclease subunit S [Herbaspirillum sp. RTI4]|uniref:restriction endonuclease subunit S n=1 Tax=Herbaspirillum sp. RTI4 TaxID=3048640 RepID=UPI002AB3474C|nr:restriction endonuclease subunit S [Herbaspirillum sp. RTI4]MDY7580088.1 restriction endonuclease subunit S [Herbaspirillum sp. RTI4]MEA9983131.1 restriction endonuclease subunit S [Herbaspirillum sp. RTI4]
MSYYKPYSAYKDSGVGWVGEVPSDWDVTPLFAVASERKESNKGMVEDNLLSLSYGSIVKKDINTNDGLLPESFETYQIVRPGDIIFRLTDLQNDKRSLRTAVVSTKGIITSAYVAVSPKSIEPRYFNYLLRAYDVQKVFYSMGGGMRQSMKFEDLRRMPILVPGKDEQEIICKMLDRETVRIDGLVSKKTSFIELLREKRQALITHAVTQGLDHSVKMKDSRVKWLGDVPAHWDVAPMKYICELLKDGTHLPPPRVDDGPRLLSVRNIVDGCFTDRDDDSKISQDDYRELCRSFVPLEGDVLLAIVGGTLGKTAIIPVKLNNFHIQRSLAIFRPRQKRMKSSWLHLIFQSSLFQSLLWEHAGYSAQPGIYLGALGGFAVPQPPIEEQTRIMNYVDIQTSPIDTLITKTERSLELLKDRRSALITAVVTGQIDVRPNTDRQDQQAA